MSKLYYENRMDCLVLNRIPGLAVTFVHKCESQTLISLLPPLLTRTFNSESKANENNISLLAVQELTFSKVTKDHSLMVLSLEHEAKYSLFNNIKS